MKKTRAKRLRERTEYLKKQAQNKKARWMDIDHFLAFYDHPDGMEKQLRAHGHSDPQEIREMIAVAKYIGLRLVNDPSTPRKGNMIDISHGIQIPELDEFLD